MPNKPTPNDNDAEIPEVAPSTDVGGSNVQATPPKERTKSFLARFFVIGVLLSIGLVPSILLWLKIIDINGFKDMVLTLGSVFGSPVGIIVNNYFKEGLDK